MDSTCLDMTAPLLCRPAISTCNFVPIIRQMDRLIVFQGQVGNAAQHRSLCELLPLPSTLKKALPRDRCFESKANILQPSVPSFEVFCQICRMRSQPAIHGSKSGFRESETSQQHADMPWPRWFHTNSADWSTWLTFKLHRLLSRSMVPKAKFNAPKKLFTCPVRFPAYFSGQHSSISPG